MPTRTKAVNVIAATAGAVPTTATMDRLMRRGRRATRPKTRRPRCCEGDLPISQIFSPNPGSVVPPGFRHADDGRRRPLDPQDRQECENHHEPSDEHLQTLHEHG